MHAPGALSPAGAELLALSPDDLNDFFAISLYGAMLQGKGSLTQADIEVLLGFSRVLEPFARHADLVGHGQELGWVVGQHVAHLHAAEGHALIVDVDSHKAS